MIVMLMIVIVMVGSTVNWQSRYAVSGDVALSQSQLPGKIRSRMNHSFPADNKLSAQRAKWMAKDRPSDQLLQRLNLVPRHLQPVHVFRMPRRTSQPTGCILQTINDSFVVAIETRRSEHSSLEVTHGRTVLVGCLVQRQVVGCGCRGGCQQRNRCEHGGAGGCDQSHWVVSVIEVVVTAGSSHVDENDASSMPNGEVWRFLVKQDASPSRKPQKRRRQNDSLVSIGRLFCIPNRGRETDA